MKLGQLRTFLSVAEHGSIRGAARALGVTQPAVTQAMRELETSLDVPLLHRGPAGVELTVYGRALARRAGLIHREIEQAVSEIDQIRDGSTGTVSVALSTAVALHLLPGAFASFRATFPSVELRLNEASVPNTLPRLLDGSVDFAVSHLMPGSLTGWNVERLFSTSMVVAVRTGHPVRTATDIQEFTDWEWLLPYDDDSAPDLVHQLFAQTRIPLPRQVVRCTSTAMGLKLVGASDLIGVFAELMVESEFPHYGVMKLPLCDPLTALDVSIITRPGAILSPAAQNFLDFLREQLPRA